MFKSAYLLLNKSAGADFKTKGTKLVNFLEPNQKHFQIPLVPTFYHANNDVVKDIFVQNQLISKYKAFIKYEETQEDHIQINNKFNWKLPASLKSTLKQKLVLNLNKIYSINKYYKSSDNDILYFMNKYSNVALEEGNKSKSIFNENVSKINRNRELNNERILLREEIDAEGRAYGYAQRMNAKAHVYVSKVLEGQDSKIFINSQYENLKDFFNQIKHRENVIYPLKAVNALNKFNVYCEVKDGGKKGRSEAIMYALAKALISYNPLYYDQIMKLNLLHPDCRVRERKKPGKKGARARFTWVKR
ncbi:hypothetical protein ACO0SA_004888 [Hanseniaspora valbyensis]